MSSNPASAPISRPALWTSRILQGLVVLFLLFDAVTKLLKVAPVLQAAARLGFSVHEIVCVGITLLVCTIIYVIPQTSVLGGVLLTGYFGGAVATQAHIGSPVFETLFPVLFGILVWLPLFIRDRRIRTLIPLRSSAA
jgi:hypothetical protein